MINNVKLVLVMTNVTPVQKSNVSGEVIVSTNAPKEHGLMVKFVKNARPSALDVKKLTLVINVILILSYTKDLAKKNVPKELMKKMENVRNA